MDALTQIETAGSVVTVPVGVDRLNLALHLGALRSQGHALVADEVITHGELQGAIRVTHYLTCKACEEKNGRQIPETSR